MRPWPNGLRHLATDQRIGSSNLPGRTIKQSINTATCDDFMSGFLFVIFVRYYCGTTQKQGDSSILRHIDTGMRKYASHGEIIDCEAFTGVP